MAGCQSAWSRCAAAGCVLPAKPACSGAMCMFAVCCSCVCRLHVAVFLRCLPACPGCCRLFLHPLFLSCREIDPDSLEIMEKLGEGEFGVVHKAKW